MKNDQLMFGNRGAFRNWLVQNHQVNPGIWLVLGKAGGPKTLTANEALEEALCFNPPPQKQIPISSASVQ